MDLAHYVIEATLREGLLVSEVAALTGKHRSWIYKILARYKAEGEAGLVPRSKRPKHSPNQVSAEIEDEIVFIRKTLSETGVDAGAETIHYHLSKKFSSCPSQSTIWRVLRKRGFITPQPKKRPKSSYIRFEADLPNETWQTDFTHWQLADETDVEILNYLDDHSRFVIASVVLPVTKAPDVVEIFHDGATKYGYPASVLSDNGAVYTAKYRGGRVLMETELERLGIVFKHSTPYHPQTCGKVERLHQTLKRYLDKKPPALSIEELQKQIDYFVDYYNTIRPHRALNRRTPKEAYESRIKAKPGQISTDPHLKVRRDKVNNNGTVTLRYNNKLHHIGIGRQHKNKRVVLLIADLNIRVITNDGELLTELDLDTSRNYQPIRKPKLQVQNSPMT